MKKINRFEPWKHQTIITNACVYSIQNRTNNKRNGFFFFSLNQSQLHAQILNNNILLTRKPIVACVFPSSNHFKCLLIIFFFFSLLVRFIRFVGAFWSWLKIFHIFLPAPQTHAERVHQIPTQSQCCSLSLSFRLFRFSFCP